MRGCDLRPAEGREVVVRFHLGVAGGFLCFTVQQAVLEFCFFGGGSSSLAGGGEGDGAFAEPPVREGLEGLGKSGHDGGVAGVHAEAPFLLITSQKGMVGVSKYTQRCCFGRAGQKGRGVGRGGGKSLTISASHAFDVIQL